MLRTIVKHSLCVTRQIWLGAGRPASPPALAISRQLLSYLSQGIRQVLTYARAYGKPAGHMVVFNLTEDPLQMPSDGDSCSWPPRIHVADRTVFLVVAQAKPLPGPSKMGALRPRVLDRNGLVREVEQM